MEMQYVVYGSHSHAHRVDHESFVRTHADVGEEAAAETPCLGVHDWAKAL